MFLLVCTRFGLFLMIACDLVCSVKHFDHTENFGHTITFPHHFNTCIVVKKMNSNKKQKQKITPITPQKHTEQSEDWMTLQVNKNFKLMM